MQIHNHVSFKSCFRGEPLRWMARSTCLIAALTMAVSAGCNRGEDDAGGMTGSSVASIVSTGALLTIDEAAPVVTAMSASEIARIRGERDLAHPVDELDSQGNPALYYATIELKYRAQLRAFSALNIYYDVLPLFPEELDALVASVGARAAFIGAPQDSDGIFVYAFIPGAVYNEFLARSAQGSSLYPTIALRTIPTVAARDHGASTRVVYSYLRSEDFTYEVDPEAATAVVPPSEVSGLEPVFDEVTSAVSSRIASIPNLVNLAPRTLVPHVNVRVALTIRSTDPKFRTSPSSQGNVMRQAWGAQRGTPISLAGAVMIARRGAGGPRHPLDAQNMATISVPKGKNVHWCLKLVNDHARVSDDGLTALRACFFNAVYDADATQPITAQHPNVNLFAIGNDSATYLRDVVGFTPLPVQILVGALANLGPVPYTYCGSYYHALNGLLATVFPGLGELAYLVFGRSDIIAADDGSSLASRGVIAHEYGHYALCGLLADAAPLRFQGTFTDLIGQAINDTVENDSNWINEGFADFMASQIVGGTNYFGPPHSVLSSFMHYCDATSNDCMDNNATPSHFPDLDATGSGGYTKAIYGVASLLSDAFDGHVPTGASNQPGNGGYFVPIFNASGTFIGMQDAPASAPRTNDEVVRLFGSALRTLASNMEDRGIAIRKESFFGALVDTMRANGWNDSQICRVFALHIDGTADARCTSLIGAFVDSTQLALSNGDLVAPLGVTCRLSASGGADCRWNEMSIAATGFTFQLTSNQNGSVLQSGSGSYAAGQLEGTASNLALPPGFSGPLHFEVRSTKAGRTGPAGTLEFTVPVPPPATCGNGSVEPGEVCDGSSATPSHCGVGRCTLVRDCIDCLQLVQECVCDPL